MGYQELKRRGNYARIAQSSGRQALEYSVAAGSTSTWAYHDIVSDNTVTIPSTQHLNSLKNNQYSYWKDLFQYEKNQTYDPVFKSTEKLHYGVFEKQLMKNAWSDNVNTDYYGLKIDSLPSGFDKKKFFKFFRENLNNLTDTYSPFSPYDETHKAIWEKEDFLGSVMRFNTPYNLDDLSVLTSKVGDCYWVFTPVRTVYDGYHPLAGHRQFGVSEVKHGRQTHWVLYLRAIDVPFTSADWVGQNQIFQGADNLWRILMFTANLTIHGLKGGAASEVVAFNRRIDWDDDIKEADK